MDGKIPSNTVNSILHMRKLKQAAEGKGQAGFLKSILPDESGKKAGPEKEPAKG